MPENQVKMELAQATGKLSIIRLVQSIIEEALGLRASDIHIDPQPENLRIRYRVDGLLRDAHVCDSNFHAEIISRIKILAGLRTDEHHIPQDGRFRTAGGLGRILDVRVSIAPTYYGENAVLRLLSDSAEQFSLQALGFSEDSRKKILAAVKRPHGIILATGPTGSGKTTALYTLLKSLNTKEVSIVTIEDPIEYSINGIEQIQVNSRAGLTFADGLRSILRQDPDIIMVGEIRDSETAGIAVNAALTGHLVLSTLHTNDAATTLPRLLDMKVEPYLIASTVNIAISQRLVRRICQQCRATKTLTPAELKSLAKLLPAKVLSRQKIFYYGQGCKNCASSGYLGRIGIQEVLAPESKIRDAIFLKAPASEIRKIAIEQGMITMLQDGLLKAQSGLTTIEEVLRVFYE